MERFELRFFNNPPEPKRVKTIHALDSLPIGANLDNLKGVFSWQLGTGFVGQYAFTFIEKSETGQWIKKEVIINILPKFTLSN